MRPNVAHDPPIGLRKGKGAGIRNQHECTDCSTVGVQLLDGLAFLKGS